MLQNSLGYLGISLNNDDCGKLYFKNIVVYGIV